MALDQKSAAAPTSIRQAVGGRQQMKILRRAVVLFFVVAFWALIWPIYPLFGGARPLILGMPLSLVYVAGWLVASFLVLLTLYLLEERR